MSLPQVPNYFGMVARYGQQPQNPLQEALGLQALQQRQMQQQQAQQQQARQQQFQRDIQDFISHGGQQNAIEPPVLPSDAGGQATTTGALGQQPQLNPITQFLARYARNPKEFEQAVATGQAYATGQREDLTQRQINHFIQGKLASNQPFTDKDWIHLSSLPNQTPQMQQQIAHMHAFWKEGQTARGQRVLAAVGGAHSALLNNNGVGALDIINKNTDGLNYLSQGSADYLKNQIHQGNYRGAAQYLQSMLIYSGASTPDQLVREGQAQQRLNIAQQEADRKAQAQDPTHQQQVKVAGHFGDEYNTIIDDGQKAIVGLDRVNQLRKLSEGFVGGNFDRLRTRFQGVLSSLDFTPESLVNREAYNARVNQLVLDMVKELKRPSQFLEQILTGSKPFTELSQAGRARVLGEISRDFTNKERLSRRAQNYYKRNNNQLDSGFFADEINRSLGAEAPTGAGGGTATNTGAAGTPAVSKGRQGNTIDVPAGDASLLFGR